jgi:CBS domain-containing protein
MIVADIMAKAPITVHPETSLEDAVHLMLKHHLPGLPVIDDPRCLVGMLTESGLLRRPELGTDARSLGRLEAFFRPTSFTTHYVHSHGRKVCHAMESQPLSVKPETQLIDAVGLMQNHKATCLAVLSKKKLIGVISQSDVLRMLSQKFAQKDNKTSPDSEIRSHILNMLAEEQWAPKSGISVTVHNGVVELKGTVFSQDERDAIKLIAENAPGAKTVEDNFVMWHAAE